VARLEPRRAVPHGKTFAPLPSAGKWVTVALAILFLGLAGWLGRLLPALPVAGRTFWLGATALLCAALGLHFLYRALTLFRLRYTITRNGVTIDWGAGVRRIPMGHITGIASAAGVPPHRPFGIPLPCWWPGRWRGVVYHATAPMHTSLAVETVTEKVVISPAGAEEFIRAWQVRASLGPTRRWLPGVERRSVFAHPLLTDAVGRRLLGGAALLSLILVGATMTAYPAWPPVIPIHFGALGQALTIADKQHLLWIPAGGALIFLFNAALGLLWYRRNRLAAYLLWFTAMLVQVGLWVGVRMVVG